MSQLSLLGQLQRKGRGRNRPYQDLTGQKFGSLKILSEQVKYDDRGYREILWECLCVCRKVIKKPTSDLTTGKVTSCGCVRNKRIKALGKAHGIDLLGQRFGKLVVTKKSKRKAHSIYWHCVCDCGGKHEVLSSNLIQGRSKSCGCVRKGMTREITAGNITLSLAQWSQQSGISTQLISYRLKSGWTPEDAVSSQPRHQSKRNNPIN